MTETAGTAGLLYPVREPSASTSMPAGHQTRRRNSVTFSSYLLGVLVILTVTGSLAPLAAVVAGFRLNAVDGWSMQPTIPYGSELISRPLAAHQAQHLKDGDVVVWHDTEGLVTHRIIRREVLTQPTTDMHNHLLPVGTVAYITQGDANPTPDPLPRASGDAADRVTGHVPGLGRWLGAPLWLQLTIVLALIAGWNFCLGLPASKTVVQGRRVAGRRRRKTRN